MRLLKLVAVLVILAVGALAGYAYLGDMQPETRQIRRPVVLDLEAAAPPPVQTVPAPAPASPPPAEMPPAGPDDLD